MQTLCQCQKIQIGFGCHLKMYGKIRAPAAEFYTLITYLKGQQTKPRGSRRISVVNADTGFEESMLTIRHLPENNLVQRRRASMCQQINETLEQMVTNEVLPFYPLAFAHGLDFMTGAYVYRETIPTWWYVIAAQPEPSRLALGYLGAAMFPVEVELVLLSFISQPVNYVQTGRGQYEIASAHWWQVITEISEQWCVPPRRLSWWGWHTTTRGPPTIYRPGHVYDPDEQARRTYFDEEFEVAADELLELNMAEERAQMAELGIDDEWVFYRAAQLALQQGFRDADELGWPAPVGIRGNPTGFRLVFDEEDSDTESSGYGSDP